MIDKSSISIAELKSVLVSLKEQKLSINDAKGKIDRVLETSTSCLLVSGLDFSKVSDSFNTTFTNLDKYFEALIDILENNVIKNYSDLLMIIRQTFNKEFADKISSLLGF